MLELLLDYLHLWFWSTWKFMFSPSVGWLSGLSFLEIFIIHTLGGWTSFLVFFRLSEYFMDRAHLKRVRDLQKGKKQKKKFTRMNKWIVKVKSTDISYYFFMLLSASFLGVQIGAIITSKFFGHRKKVWLHSLLIYAGMSILYTFLWRFFDPTISSL